MSCRITENSRYFDESGKFADHSIVSFCGLVAENVSWNLFLRDWTQALRKHNRTKLHMWEEMRAFSPELLKVLMDFVVVIKQTIELGVIATIDIKGFKALPSHLQKQYGDPYFIVFNTAMDQTIKYLITESDPRVGIICDDEEKYAVHCYKLFTKARRETPELRKVLTSICFGDDEHFQQLQAADLLAYVIRSEASHRFHNEPNKCAELYAKFLTVEPGDKIVFRGGDWVGPDTLQALKI